MWKSQNNAGYQFCLPPFHLLWDRVSLSCRWPESFQGFSCLFSHLAVGTLELYTCITGPGLYIGSCDLNSELHTWQQMLYWAISLPLSFHSLWLNKIVWCVCAPVWYFLHLSVDVLLGWFCKLVVVNSDAVNTNSQLSVVYCLYSFRCIPKSGITKSYYPCVFNFFNSGWTNSHSHQ